MKGIILLCYLLLFAGSRLCNGRGSVWAAVRCCWLFWGCLHRPAPSFPAAQSLGQRGALCSGPLRSPCGRRRAGLFHKAVVFGIWAVAVVYFYWTLSSRSFVYVWDYANYLLKQYDAEAAFAQSAGAGLAYIFGSMADDYTTLSPSLPSFPSVSPTTPAMTTPSVRCSASCRPCWCCWRALSSRSGRS